VTGCIIDVSGSTSCKPQPEHNAGRHRKHIRLDPSLSSLAGFAGIVDDSAWAKKLFWNRGTSRLIASVVPNRTVPAAYAHVYDLGAALDLVAVDTCLKPVRSGARNRDAIS
jgi:hypothetical protein